MGHYDDVFEKEREFLSHKKKNHLFNVLTEKDNCYTVLKNKDVIEIFPKKVKFPYEPLLRLQLPTDYVIVKEALEAYEKGMERQYISIQMSIEKLKKSLEEDFVRGK